MVLIRNNPNKPPELYAYIDFHKHLSDWCTNNGFSLAIEEGESNSWVLKAEEEWLDTFRYGLKGAKPQLMQCGRVYRPTCTSKNEEEVYLSRPAILADGYTKTDEHDALQMISYNLIFRINKRRSINIIDFDEEKKKHKRDMGPGPQYIVK